MSRIITVACLNLLLLVLAGCKTEAPPETLRILGTPPGVAVFGSEYTYEFAIDGGEGLYSATLSNAPAWMAVEYNTNKFRPGIVIRGIPGVTGAGSFEELIEREYPNIDLTVTEGNALGSTVFTLQVRNNQAEIRQLDVAEAEQQDRPKIQGENPDTGLPEAQDIPFCQTRENGEALFSEADHDYWRELIDLFEAAENGEAVDPEALQAATDAFGGLRPRIAYLAILVASPSIVDSRFSYAVTGSGDDTRNGAIAGEDFLTEVPLADGSTVDIDSGWILLPAGETACAMTVFINDDRVAELEETISIGFEYLNTDGYFSERASGSIEITDNEATAAWAEPVGSVSEIEPADVVAFPENLERLAHRVRLQMTETPLQDQVAGNEVVVRVVFLGDNSNGTFTTIPDLGSLTSVTADVALLADVDYLRPAPDNTYVDVVFNREAVDPEVDDWVSARELVFLAPRNNDGSLTADEQLLFGIARTDSVLNNSTSIHTLSVNEWTTPYNVDLPAGSTVEVIESGGDGAVYLGLRKPEADTTVSEIQFVNRLGQREQTIPLGLDGLNIEIEALAAYETGIPDPSLGQLEQIRDLFVLMTVDGLYAAPLDPGGTGVLAGRDLVLAKYRKVNEVGRFELAWQRQFGTLGDDRGGSLTVRDDGAVYVVGTVQGDFLDDTARGGEDGVVAYFSNDGSLIDGRIFGTRYDDAFLTSALTRQGYLFAGGYTSANVQGVDVDYGRDFLTAEFTDDMTLRRTNEIPRLETQQVTGATELTRGFVTVSEVEGALSRAEVGEGGFDVVLAFQDSASAIDAALQIGTPEDETASAVVAVGDRFFAGGGTGGALFEDSIHGGGTDWWVVGYDAVRPDPAENDRELREVWSLQGGGALDERLAGLAATNYGKVFKVVETRDESATRLSLLPFAVTDGRDLALDE